MTGQLVAIVGLAVSLIAAVFGFGLRLGTLSERVDQQTKQVTVQQETIKSLSVDLQGTRLEITRWMAGHDTRRER